MMLEHIRQWLNNHQQGSLQDFEQGLLLIKSYLPAEYASLKMLRSESKLYNCLADYFRANKHSSISIVAHEEIQTMPTKKSSNPNREESISMSASIEKLDAEWKKLRKESGTWHAELYSIGRTPTGTPKRILNTQEIAKRSALAKLIMSNEKAIRHLWLRIDHIKLYGKDLIEPLKEAKQKQLPSSNKELKEKLRQRRYKLETNIREAQSKISSLSGKDLIKLNKKLDKWEIELKEVHSKFNSMLIRKQKKIINGI